MRKISTRLKEVKIEQVNRIEEMPDHVDLVLRIGKERFVIDLDRYKSGGKELFKPLRVTHWFESFQICPNCKMHAVGMNCPDLHEEKEEIWDQLKEDPRTRLQLVVHGLLRKS